MSLLFNVLFAWKCKNTHHKLALDALTQLRCPGAAAWRNLFLANIEPYLEGAKAPDDRFKDFRNHVLHVAENHWGGAIQAANQWRDLTVAAFRERDWTTAVYRSGVLSHYYSDPLQPLHTAQSDAEGNIHRAAEWSIAQSYDALRSLLTEELGGFPDVAVPTGPNWLEKMIRQGADAAFPHYQTILDHYDIDRGVKDPPAGLDRELQVCIARLIGHAVSGFARILERCFEDASAAPPSVSVSLSGALSALTIPVYWVTKRMANAAERAQVEATYRELQKNGLVKQALSEDDRTIRQLHAREVLKTTEEALDAKPPAKTGARHQSDRPSPRPAASSEKTAAKPQSRPPQETAAAATATVGPSRRDVPAPQQARPAAKTPPPSEKPPEAPSQRETEATQLKPAPAPVREPVPQATIDASVTPPVRAPAPEHRSEAEFESARPAAPPLTNEKPPAAVAAPVETALPAASPSANKPKPAVAAKFHLDIDAPVVDAPSIGPKTADRLRSTGIETVADLLTADAAAVAPRLNQKQTDADTVEEWKRQAALMLRIPGLRGHDAQILVACGINEPEDLLTVRPEDLLDLVDTFCCSPEGERVLRETPAPDLEEIQDWIIAAAQARPLPQSVRRKAA